MRKRIAIALVPACALLGLAGCDNFIRGMGDDAGSDVSAPVAETAPVEETAAADEADKPVYTQAMSQEAEIDWLAARDDVASNSGSNGNFMAASQEGDPPPVPVMLPTGIVLPQGAESDVKFQPLSDGYFAFYPGTDYNIVVNGTNEIIGERAPGTTETPMRFIPTMSGAQVAFTKYGADYLIEFECTVADGEHADCISEEDALSIADSLVAVRSR
ncbi:hypothetical protein [uncultured Hyphomonas sp.]|uniref:hypothetical protein n=1 Tax=uncultured Hyphomonas sp. TaxID=225298 RepID=UPI002AAAC41D|nr:hypothetical protein [uncultured Hyphomonas sp.]